MLVFPCFPAIARRGFAKLVRADLAKPTRFCMPSFSQTPTFVGQNKNGGDAKSRVLPRKSVFAQAWQKVQKRQNVARRYAVLRDVHVALFTSRRVRLRK